MGTTVATNALLERKGEPHAAGHHARLSRRAAHRLPEPAAPVRPPHRAARAAVRARGRGRRAGRRARRGRAARSTSRRCAATCRPRSTPASAAAPSSSCTATATPPTSRRRREWRARIGFTQVSVSHEVSPLMKLVSRGDTTVVDAYLSPILRRYVDQVAAQMPGVRLFFMQSSGGLTEAHRFQGKDAILSGPAGGIVGMVRTAVAAGHHKVIGFDMGGTSTDVSHYAGEFERAFETQVAGVRMRAPMMSIHTVAAGGGSILQFDGARLRVGPDSAGANPGPGELPARRAAGGDRCQRDARASIQPAHFPKVFGPAANESLDRDGVVAKFRRAGRRREAQHRPRGDARIAGRRLRADRGAEHGQRDQAHLGGARLRRHAVHAAMLRRRRRPARLPGGRCARHDAACSCIRWPACCRPTAWGWPTRSRCARRRSSARWTMPAWPRRAPTLAELGAAARDEVVSQGVAAPVRRAAPARAPALPGHRHRAGGRLRHDRRTARGVRGRLPPALRVPDARPAAGGRSGVGRGGGRRRAPRSAGDQRRSQARTRRAPTRRCACTSDGWLDAGLFVRESLARRRDDRRPGDHRREERHHRGRARLAGGADRSRADRAARA